MEFTREMAITMTWEEVQAFWIEQQRERKAAGEDHYETLMDPTTGRVFATIEE